MQTHKVILQLGAPSLTPWNADTLFGHLCWALARHRGDSAVTAFLERYRAGDPPLLLSDGFPGDLLPRPLFPPAPIGTGNLLAQQAALHRQAKIKHNVWLSLPDFQQILRGEEVVTSSVENPLYDFYTLHNQINRASGTTSGTEENTDAGQLYPHAGEWCAQRVIYVRVSEEIAIPWKLLFDDLAHTGFGKRKSVGYGAITGLQIEECNDFPELPEANGFVSLSAFVPARTDPTDGYWKMDVKYGKLGEEFASSPKPFKKPLLRLLSGSVFRTESAPRPFYGRLVENIIPIMPEVVQYGFAFAIGLRWPD